MSEATDIRREELRAQLAAIVGSAPLKAEELKRKPEFQGRQVETLAIAQDNVLMAKHPEMTQFLGPEEQRSLEALGQALPGIASSVPSAATPTRAEAIAAPIAAPPQPPVRQPAPNRILLTGRSGVGKNFLAAQVSGARVVELTDPLTSFLRKYYPDYDTTPLADTIKVWGEGIVNAQFPLTPARLVFTEWMHGKGWEGFGGPGYWVNRLLEGSDNHEQIIVTRVESSADFKSLVAAGFKHYHVVASTSTFNTRPQRKNADNRLAAALDQDVIQKLSRQRQGPRLNVIWNDPASQPPSQRVFTVSQWLQEMQTEAMPEMGE